RRAHRGGRRGGAVPAGGVRAAPSLLVAADRVGGARAAAGDRGAMGVQEGDRPGRDRRVVGGAVRRRYTTRGAASLPRDPLPGPAAPSSPRPAPCPPPPCSAARRRKTPSAASAWGRRVTRSASSTWSRR